MAIIDPFLLAVLIFFTIVTMHKFLQRKKKMALYFALSNLCLTLSILFVYLGTIDAIEYGEITDMNRFGVFMMNIFITASALFLFLFSDEIFPSAKKNIYIILGFGTMIFMLLPQNQWMSTEPGFKLKFISFLLMFLYSIFVYLRFMQFFKLANQIPDMKKSFNFIGLGAVFMILMMTFSLIRSMSDSFVLWLFSMLCLIISIIFTYFGFIHTALKGDDSKKNKK
jgi:hypothetical protein